MYTLMSYVLVNDSTDTDNTLNKLVMWSAYTGTTHMSIRTLICLIKQLNIQYKDNA
jgi:hypothetical protein